MTTKPDSFAYPPRGLSREEAARYIGVGTSTSMMTQREVGICFPQSDLSGLIDWHLSPDHNYSACELLDTVPIAILFVCTANICRSPMAEGVFRSMARRAGLASAFSVDSAGTFDGYVGKPPVLPAIKAAALRGYGIANLRARQVVAPDIARFDYVLAMDRSHLADLQRMTPPRALRTAGAVY